MKRIELIISWMAAQSASPSSNQDLRIGFAKRHPDRKRQEILLGPSQD
jgi:hypothetical protein